MLRCSVGRRPASAAEVAAAIASIDSAPGIYFGCDAGVAGLHPLQAVLVAGPALALDVFVDGVTVAALDAFGESLLRHPALAGFVALAGRDEPHPPLAALRAFLDAWGGSHDVLLVGALGFAAHRLAAPLPASAAQARAGASLGVFYFAPSLLRRDAAGLWEHVALEFDDPALAAALAVRGRARPAPARKPQAAEDARSVADDFAPGGYAAVVARAVQRLAASPLVSLTLSQSFRRAVGDVPVARAFETLRRGNPAPATFFFNTGAGERVFGASPDLQLRVLGRQVEAFPVCGTVARGHGPVGEAESFRSLLNEAVDAASLAVCSDALRDDLAPLCEPGSLRLRDRRRPMALATVVHTVDRLGGLLRDGVDAWDAIVATAAPVMATGTPRRLALAAIAELEAGPRGWYGGLVVQVASNGDALVGTLLRAAVLRGGVAEVRTGGDLLADSQPDREEQESRIKAVSLWRALGLAVAADLQTEVAGRDPEASAPIEARPLAIALRDAGDPFAAAMAETLRGLGFVLDAAAPTAVLIGRDERSGRPSDESAGRLVAVGDAAMRVLQDAGFAVTAIRPEHGRIVRCLATPAAPWQPLRPFFAARYATLAVDWAAAARPPGAADWVEWLRDDQGVPLVLANETRRVVCLLIRPESLLSDEPARAALRAAIGFAGNSNGAAGRGRP